jgi:hypothetical protein
MKKRLSIALALSFCLSLLCGCTILPGGVGHFHEGDATPDVTNTTFGFDSYKDMIRAFGKRDIDPNHHTIQELKQVLGEPYADFVDRVNAEGSFPKPLLNNQLIPYRNEEGFSNITFFAGELYGLPWVWYFPRVSTGENFYIAVTYLPDGIAQAQSALTASEAIQKLSPNSANIQQLGDGHKAIYEKPLPLNGCEVTALVMEYKDDTRASIFFVWNDLLVMVRCNPEVWTDAWFAELSFEK